jgi:hypothetical protein
VIVGELSHVGGVVFLLLTITHVKVEVAIFNLFFGDTHGFSNRLGIKRLTHCVTPTYFKVLIVAKIC